MGAASREQHAHLTHYGHFHGDNLNDVDIFYTFYANLDVNSLEFLRLVKYEKTLNHQTGPKLIRLVFFSRRFNCWGESLKRVMKKPEHSSLIRLKSPDIVRPLTIIRCLFFHFHSIGIDMF